MMAMGHLLSLGGFGRSDVELAVNSSRVAGDNLAWQQFSQLQAERRFSRACRTNNCNYCWRLDYSHARGLRHCREQCADEVDELKQLGGADQGWYDYHQRQHLPALHLIAFGDSQYLQDEGPGQRDQANYQETWAEKL